MMLGVPSRLSAWIDVTIVQKNGKSISAAPTATTANRSPRRARRAEAPGVVRLECVGSASTPTSSVVGSSTTVVADTSGIGHPPALEARLHERDAEHEDEEHPRQRRRGTDAAVAEREVVDVLHDGARRARGPAARHHVHLVEDLEAVDDRDDDDE